MTAPILMLIAGLVVLTAGADFLVRGAAGLAARLGLSPLLIGLTVVSFGTSAPELVVSVTASRTGQGGIALGNIIGSNIFNVAAILGLAALIYPLGVHLKVIRIDMPIMLGASLLFAVLLRTGGGISRWEGGVLVGGLVAYLGWTFVAESREAPAEVPGIPEIDSVARTPVSRSSLQLVGGILGLVLGGALLVDNATVIARELGVEEAVIGLTIVAAGTSLPELATSVIAAARRETDIAIGNVVGSNIFNLLAIGGTAALVNPVAGGGIQNLDIGMMLGSSLLLLPLMRSGFRLTRPEGALLLLVFAAYMILLWP